MISTGYDAGREEMREQIVALIYERYMHYRTFHGADSDQALMLKNLIHTIRDDHAKEIENVEVLSH